MDQNGFDLTKVTQASPGFLLLLKRIPFLSDFLQYEENAERQNVAISEATVNEYRLINDPVFQLQTINSISDPQEKRLIVGHLLSVSTDRTKNLNLLAVLDEFYNNSKNTDFDSDDSQTLHPDWWLLWHEKAQMSSDPIKQKIYAAMLEAEAKKLGTISPRLLRVLADLSIPEIEMFQETLEYLPKSGRFFTGFKLGDTCLGTVELRVLKDLADAGLLGETVGFGEYMESDAFEVDSRKCHAIEYEGYALLVWLESTKIQIHYAARLTNEGTQLRSLLPKKENLDFLKEIARKVHAATGAKVTIHKFSDPGFSKTPIFDYSGSED